METNGQDNNPFVPPLFTPADFQRLGEGVRDMWKHQPERKEERQKLTLEQALTLSFRICEARMRKPGDGWFTGAEIKEEIKHLMQAIEIVGEVK